MPDSRLFYQDSHIKIIWDTLKNIDASIPFQGN